MKNRNNNFIKKTEVWVIVFFIFFAAILSFYKLATRNLWFDEAANFLVAQKIFEKPVFFIHPALYFKLLHLVIISFGQNEFFLRLFSAIFGIISIIIFYFFSRRIANKKVAFLGTFLLTLSPLRIWYSQEASPHIMAFCLVLAAIYSFYLFINKNTFKNLFFWILFNLLSFYISSYALLLIPAQMLYFLLVRKEMAPSIKKTCLLGLLIQLLLYLPQLNNFLNSLLFVKQGFWIPPIGPNALKYTIMNFFLGYNGTALAYNLVFTIFCLGLIYGFFQPSLKKIFRVFIAFGVFPLLTVLLLHPFIKVYLDRHNLIFMPVFFLLISASILTISSKLVKYVGFCLLISAMICSMINYYQDIMPLSNRQRHIAGVYLKNNFTKIVTYVEKKYQSDDVLAITSPGILTPIYFYVLGKKEIYYFFAQDDDYWTRGMSAYKPKHSLGIKFLCGDAEWGKLLFMDSPVNEELALDFLPKRIWLLQSSWSRDGTLDSNSIKIEAILRKRYFPSQQKWIEGVLVSLYTKNSLEDIHLSGSKGKE